MGYAKITAPLSFTSSCTTHMPTYMTTPFRMYITSHAFAAIFPGSSQHCFTVSGRINGWHDKPLIERADSIPAPSCSLHRHCSDAVDCRLRQRMYLHNGRGRHTSIVTDPPSSVSTWMSGMMSPACSACTQQRASDSEPTAALLKRCGALCSSVLLKLSTSNTPHNSHGVPDTIP